MRKHDEGDGIETVFYCGAIRNSRQIGAERKGPPAAGISCRRVSRLSCESMARETASKSCFLLRSNKQYTIGGREIPALQRKRTKPRRFPGAKMLDVPTADGKILRVFS
jgi:hypothetical protein